MFHSIRAIPLCISVTMMAGACAGPDVFDNVPPAETPDIANVPYPRLADVEPGGRGPDPATGDAVLIDLSAAADAAEIRREATQRPIQ